VGTTAPLTLAAVPPVGPLAPREPAAELDAPGNGVTRENPLLVRTINPRLLSGAGTIRRSSMHSNKLGLSDQSRFIDAHSNRIFARVEDVSTLTDQSVHFARVNSNENSGVGQGRFGCFFSSFFREKR
jgi:hypothetical protein